MDINEIKKMIKSRNDKIVIIENDRPTLVVMPYEAYEGINTFAPKPREPQKPYVATPAREEEIVPQAQSGEGLTLKDLPFV